MRICTCLYSEVNEYTCRKTFKEQMTALFSKYEVVCFRTFPLYIRKKNHSDEANEIFLKFENTV